MNKNYQLRAAGTKTAVIYLLHYEYGYAVQVHEHGRPGYVVNKQFTDLEKAKALFNKLSDEYQKKV